VRGIELAQQLGFTRIRTDSDSRNLTMISINENLGFKHGPSSITLQRAVGTRQ
jgi:hypothetical protein